jgi:hypothetical protein
MSTPTGDDEYEWLDREAGPVVRPYAMTGGRVRPSAGGFDLLTYVVAEDASPPHDAALQPEHLAIIELTRRPRSVAEIASGVDLALGVVRVLLGDLLHHRLITVHEPPGGGTSLPNEDVIKAVIDGLKAL